ncbi:MAG TPA: CHASE3 domain-containing protein, partial [Pilimelia sp.]|nr:CHASE3 domain-containing protein [Pilimelia sp.]
MTSGPVVTGSSGSAAGQPAATAAPAAAGRASPSGADEAPGRGLAAGTVGGLMWRAVAAIVLVIVLAGGAGVAAVSGQHAALRELSGHLVPLRLANAQLRAVLTDAGRDLRGYLLTGDAEFLRAHTDASARLAPAVAALRQRAGTARERAAVAQQSRLSDAWWAEAGRQRQVTP